MMYTTYEPMAQIPLQPILRLYAALNRHAVPQALRQYSPDYEGFDLTRSVRYQGVDHVKGIFEDWFAAFPDLHIEGQIVAQQQDALVVGWTVVGTHRGTFMHIPRTDRQVSVTGMSTWFIAQNRLVRGMHLWDMAGLLRELKLLPDLPETLPGQGPAQLFSSFLTRVSTTHPVSL